MSERKGPPVDDGNWKQYYPRRQFHHYGLIYGGQTADCGASTDGLAGMCKPMTAYYLQFAGVCGRCRKIVEQKTRERAEAKA